MRFAYFSLIRTCFCEELPSKIRLVVPVSNTDNAGPCFLKSWKGTERRGDFSDDDGTVETAAIVRVRNLIGVYNNE